MNIAEIAARFVALCQEGKFDEAGDTFWSDDVVSIEPMPGGGTNRAEGRAALLAKRAWWYANHEMHGASCTGPYVGEDQFAVRFTLEVTAKQSGQRMSLDEIGLYTVRDGRIVEEKFLYGSH